MKTKTVRTYPCMKNADLKKECARKSSHTAGLNGGFRVHTCGTPFEETFNVVEVPFNNPKYTSEAELKKLSGKEKTKARRINRSFIQLDTGTRDENDQRIYYYKFRGGIASSVRAFQMINLINSTQKQLTA